MDILKQSPEEPVPASLRPTNTSGEDARPEHTQPEKAVAQEGAAENASMADAASRNMLWLLPLFALGISFVLANTHLHGPPCLMRTLLHIPCPGCGMTRSFNALWHGDLVTSFRFHPLGMPLFGVFAVYGLCAALQRRVPSARSVYGRWTRAFNAPRFWKVALGLLLGVWGARLGLMLSGNHYFMW